jgi:peroxiredoxin
VLGVSYDTPEANAAFVEKYRFPYRLASDTDRAVARAFGAFDEGKPDYPRRNTYVIGADGTLEQVLDGVNPKTSPRDVFGALS